MKLIIVESPTKAKTISRFLSKDFRVESSYGHVRDLPVSKLGIDIEERFSPRYVIPQKAKARVVTLKKAAKDATEIILATDEDREGEAIAWHLVQALGLNKSSQQPAMSSQQKGEKIKKPEARSRKPEVAIARIVFHEITKKAIEEALQHPRDIDMRLVDAQQARRVLDRLVGYKLSPFLWKKLMRGLSAGRVQSVALRLVAEREAEREAFKTQEYWSITALLRNKNPFEALLIKKNAETLEKFAIKNEKEAKTIAAELEKATYRVADAQKKQTQKNPLPPFTTSTLQQDASQRFGFSAKQTMRIAQELYETGLITYMRTDSVNLSQDSRRSATSYLTHILGASYALSEGGRVFKTKTKGAQEAHEAIRPTDPAKKPDDTTLDTRQKKLYELIWRRFLASQMPAAIIDSVVVDIAAAENHKLPATNYILRATGQTIRFDGFLNIYPLHVTERELPPCAVGDPVTCENIIPQQHFTEPPPRFTEATLIKTLEQNGVGRPSTYAPTMALLQDRGYVEKDEHKRLFPSVVGRKINEMLVAHFPRIVDIQFTAHMEEELDQIAAGRLQWQPVIEEFYAPFAEHLEEKYASVEKISLDRPSEEHCEKCGKPMIIKHGRFGEFIACSGFPECKNTKKIPPPSTGITCPECNEGEIVMRSTKKGRKFYGCSRYPECTYATWQNPGSEMSNVKAQILNETQSSKSKK